MLEGWYCLLSTTLHHCMHHVVTLHHFMRHCESLTILPNCVQNTFQALQTPLLCRVLNVQMAPRQSITKSVHLAANACAV